ncbi:MAG: hypothetical protein H6623_08365 [Bdellovibrionaceae bacterium]|nr:hypothetical protein [Pseudobdellovibrionaceae bacterium]
MLRIFAYILSFLLFYTVSAQAVAPTVQQGFDFLAESNSILEMASYPYFMFSSEQTQEAVVEGHCLIDNCQFQLELVNPEDFTILENKAGSTISKEVATLSFKPNIKNTTDDAILIDAKVILYTTNLKENVTVIKNIPVFIYK